MDVSRIQEEIAADEEGSTFEVHKKNGDLYRGADGKPSTITVLGSDAKRVRAVKDAQTRRLLRLQRTRLEPEDLRANRIELAAAAVTGWSGWEANGEPWPCTPENVAQLLRADHILVQTEEEIDRPRNFSTSSSETSSSSPDTTRTSRSPRRTDAHTAAT